MLQYFRPVKYDNYTLSIDNVVCDYHFHPKSREDLMRLLDRLSIDYCCEVTHWDNLKIGTFKLQFSISIGQGNSFWIGCGLNQSKTEWGKIRIEFNPNKVARHEVFRKVLAFLNAACSPMHTTIRRFDLAIDFPCLRENAFLIKDSRFYREDSYSESDRTQYLGKKNSGTYVKLYNKQVESKLPRPLTRLELTIDPKQNYEDINFPTVYFVNDLQVAFDEMKLCGSDRFILDGLIANPSKITMLDRKLRAKMERLMSDYVIKFDRLSREHYNAICSQLTSFTNFPAKPLDDFKTNMDFLSDYVTDYTRPVYFKKIDLEIGDIFEGVEECE